MDTHNYYGQQDTDCHIVPITLSSLGKDVPYPALLQSAVKDHKLVKADQTSQG